MRSQDNSVIIFKALKRKGIELLASELQRFHVEHYALRV